jgi:hypothetical protein
MFAQAYLSRSKPQTSHPINKAQLLSYMKLLDIPLGLIINVNELHLDRRRIKVNHSRRKS